MDSIYLKKVIDGDIDSYKYFVQQYQKMAIRTAMAIVKNEADAQDLVQESFIKAFEVLHSFQEESKFSTWLCRIVINNCLKFIQKKQAIKEDLTEFLPRASIEFNQGLEQLENKELEDMLKKGLNLLPAKESLCIQLFYLEQFKINEIEEITGFTKANIKVLLHRGRKHLYNYLNHLYNQIK